MITVNLSRYASISFTAQTVAELRTIPVTQIEDGMIAFVGGQTTPTDGLGGIYTWNAASSTADDGQNTIAPTGSATGRWKRAIAGIVGTTGPAGTNVMSLALATQIATTPVPASTNLIGTVGYSANGKGAGVYVADSLADAALMAAHPLAVKQEANGRIFRLLPDSEGLISVASMGVIGTDTPNHSTNHQTGIQAALDYAHAITAHGIRFTERHYSVWTPLRTPTSTGTEINTDFTGRPIVINGSKVIQASARGTTLWRRTNNGGDPNVWANTQLIDTNNTTSTTNGVHWRGGMIFMKGQGTSNPASRPTDYESLANLTLRGDLSLKGGLPMSATPGVANGANYKQLNADGSGWDITDKAIWFENDRHTGDLILDGNITLDGFRGEVIYQGGKLHGSIIQTSGRLMISNSDADGLNPGPCYHRDGGYGRVTLHDLMITNCWQALEGWAGDGGLLRGMIANCPGDATMQGGKAGAGTYSLYYAPIRFEAGVLPRCELDLTLRNCGTFFIGSFMGGRVSAFDTKVKIGDPTAYADGVRETYMDVIEVFADNKNIDTAVSIGGGNASGSQLTTDIRVGLLRVGKTKSAALNGYSVSCPLQWAGGSSYGPRIVIECLDAEATTYPRPFNNTVQTDYRPMIHDWRMGTLTTPPATLLSASQEQNVETSANLTPLGPIIKLQKTNNGAYEFTMQTTNAQHGERVTLYSVAGTTTVFILATANTRNAYRVPITNNQRIVLEFDGSQWVMIEAPQKIVNTAAFDPAAIAANTGANQSITVLGARTGMPVFQVIPSAWTTAGLIAYGASITANDTVTFRLHNPTGASIDAASASVTTIVG